MGQRALHDDARCRDATGDPVGEYPGDCVHERRDRPQTVHVPLDPLRRIDALGGPQLDQQLSRTPQVARPHRQTVEALLQGGELALACEREDVERGAMGLVELRAVDLARPGECTAMHLLSVRTALGTGVAEAVVVAFVPDLRAEERLQLQEVFPEVVCQFRGAFLLGHLSLLTLFGLAPVSIRAVSAACPASSRVLQLTCPDRRVG